MIKKAQEGGVMLTFFESYHEEYWPGLDRRGLLTDRTGVRFCQSRMLPRSLKFNDLAARGGRLWKLLAGSRRPMYIDRLQGGGYIEEYPYDRTLLADYRRLLGDRFYGFQLHEWASNYRSDLRKLEQAGLTRFREKDIEEAIFRLYPFPNLFLESMTAAELEQAGRPETALQFDRNLHRLYAMRKEQVQDLIPCDSFGLSFRLAAEQGARHIMPEIGAQSPNTRLQLALALGTARSWGISFGAYLEPWGGDPFSTCCYHREGRNEWNLQGGDFPFQANGEQGGSSRSLQMRMMLYAWLSGAEFLSEEWGMCNTFLDWKDYELSPYGLVKKRFLELEEKYPRIGEKLTPVAVVLPQELKVLDYLQQDDTYFDYPAEQGGRLLEIRQKLNLIFADNAEEGRMARGEAGNIINSRIPDGAVIVYEDAPDLDRYEAFVDLTGGAELPGRRIQPDEVGACLEQLLPCRVEGGLHWMVNRRPEGGYYLSVFNNRGVERTAEHGEQALPGAEKTARIFLKNGRRLRPLEGQAREERGVWETVIAPGGWFFAEF